MVYFCISQWLELAKGPICVTSHIHIIIYNKNIARLNFIFSTYTLHRFCFKINKTDDIMWTNETDCIVFYVVLYFCLTHTAELPITFAEISKAELVLFSPPKIKMFNIWKHLDVFVKYIWFSGWLKICAYILITYIKLSVSCVLQTRIFLQGSLI